MKKLLLLFFIFIISCVMTKNENNKISQEQKNEVSKLKIQLAIEYMNNNDYRSAISAIEESLKNDSQSINGWLTRAYVYQEIGNYDEAEKSYKKALSLDKNRGETLNNYGWFLCNYKNDYNTSIDYFNKSLADVTSPTPYYPQMNKGICIGKAGNYVTAEHELKKAMYLNKNFYEPIKELARLKYQEGDHKEANKLFFEFYNKSSFINADSLLLAWKISNSLGNKKNANNFRKLLEENFPDSKEIRELL